MRRNRRQVFRRSWYSQILSTDKVIILFKMKQGIPGIPDMINNHDERITKMFISSGISMRSRN